MPLLMPIVVIIFTIVAKEPIWKKALVMGLFLTLTVVRFVVQDITVTLIAIFMQVIFFILLLMYFRNRGVI